MTKLISRRTKKHIIKEKISLMIEKEGLQPGDQIMSQNQLADYFKVNALTVCKALSELCEENLLYRETGRGTFVGPAPQQLLNIALVLPGEHLEDPEINPDHWPFVSNNTRILMEACGTSGTFSTIALPDSNIENVDPMRFRNYDLLFSFGIDDFHILAKKLVDQNICCPVLFSKPLDDLNAIYISFSRTQSVKLGITELLVRGYRRIGIFCGEEYWFNDDIKGYQSALQNFGIDVNPELIFRGYHLQKHGKTAAAMLMARSMPCDAIFADTDLLALGMVDFFRNKDLKIPEDIGVMGFEGLSLATNQPPFLSSIRIPHKQMVSWAINEYKKMNGTIKTVSKEDFIGDLIPGKTIKQEN